ncbi:exo-rhamnogalacturonan lyase family protein [Sphingomonas sp. CFBP 13720]|uniref:exo-rhamnogalacturonan lyase family protein n=1 Tax=Sphingomonas sp. CFBP 13720 TaxID=2775302 RepID=UPI00177D613B|nr:Tat pathway signal sequence domain protein [Sphingomonas sp. CFBP 13720]MBD8676985.1 Tat pathway signal sequence domain protein [Sphingomonas sp. CFBP 13720]
MRLTRRTLLASTMVAATVRALPGVAATRPAPLARAKWVDGTTPTLHAGQTFGLAWPRGTVTGRQSLAVRDAAGRPIPAQSWITATWPDGSVKWTAHALPADAAIGSGLQVTPGRAAAPADPVRVEERGDLIVIRSGDLRWEIPRVGDAVIRQATRGGRAVLRDVALVGEVRRGSPDGPRIPLKGTIERVTIEQRGPVRAVVKVEGRHMGGGQSALPFTVRLYAYAGSEGLRVVHSFVHDLDPAQWFVSGIGVATSVPMTAPLHDRHVRFALGDDTMFVEAVRPLTGLRRDPGAATRAAQVAGKATPPPAAMDKPVGDLIERIPAWGDVSLTQLSAGGFTLRKRTAPGHAWIDAAEGGRAPGFGYVGSPSGGAALSARWFWQRHPTEIAVADAASDAATLTMWLWSPQAAAMDLRPYRDTMSMEAFAAQNEGLAVTYEDYEPGWDTAVGVARTSELMLWAFGATPPTARLQELATIGAQPPQLVADAAGLHAAGVFGDWSLPDRSTPNRTAIENQLTNLVDFYAGEVDRRHWYGFWNHGDVMHTYDADRHQWRYDIGGFAWANSELSPDLWLWLQAVRTGGGQAYRLAEAMTRHTGEVDVYHLGRFRGMGTRHGVQHWSDSSKQPRVSTAAYRRIFYYLTADERVGDLMRDLLDSANTLTQVEIGRKVPGAARPVLPPGTIEMSFGTVWCSLAAAWLTEWERTGDIRWRDRLVAGMDSIGRLKNGWMAGSAPYHLASGRFVGSGDQVSLSHLNAVFGAVEVNAELLGLLDVPGYRAAWLDYCRYYNAPKAAFEARFGPRKGSENLGEAHSRLTAYAARATGDAALATRGAGEFFAGRAGLGVAAGDPRIRLPGGVVEWPGVSTNAASQWGLAAIQNLALIPAAIDAFVPRARR